MKIRAYFPFLVFAALILFVGLACGTYSAVPPTKEPPLAPTLTQKPESFPPLAPSLTPSLSLNPIPTQTDLPTDAPLPQSGDLIYSTTFGDLSDWTIYTKDDRSIYTIENRPDGLFITIPGANDYAYFYHDIGSADVRLESDVELVGGTNYTYIQLVCRSTDKGEYIFVLDTGGLWQIARWDAENSQYERLKDGGSTQINVAKAKNHMTAICQGDTLTFKINGTTLGTVTDSRFLDGYIGIEINTYDYPRSDTMIHNLEVYLP